MSVAMVVDATITVNPYEVASFMRSIEATNLTMEIEDVTIKVYYGDHSYVDYTSKTLIMGESLRSTIEDIKPLMSYIDEVNILYDMIKVLRNNQVDGITTSAFVLKERE